MTVTMSLLGKSDGPKTVKSGGGNASFTINTGLAAVKAGKITFELTWATGGSETDSRTVSYQALDCSPKPTPIVPPEPTKVDKCEPADGSVVDGVLIPETDKGSYTINGKPATAGFNPVDGTSADVTFTASKGNVVKEGATDKWTYTFTKEACVVPPTPTPKPTLPPRLPNTGSGESVSLAVLGLALLVAGTIGLGVRRQWGKRFAAFANRRSN